MKSSRICFPRPLCDRFPNMVSETVLYDNFPSMISEAFFYNNFPSMISEVFYDRFPEGASLTVAAEEYIPHVEVAESPGPPFSFKGPMANLLDILAKSMNFT